MLSQHYLDRFSGIARLYGQEALIRLYQSHICIVGVGGVGSWAAEALARSGVGEITLIDLDDICISNSNRQIQALTSSVGQFKVDVLSERLKDINPDIQIHAVTDYITHNNLADLINPEFDYVLDCIDSVKNKAALIAHCKRNKIKLITTGGAGGQIDPTQIQIKDLNKTTQDPLAKKVRSLLRRDYGFSKTPTRNYGIPCVTSTEALRYPQPDGSVSQYKVKAEEVTKLDCASGFGASTMVTASFGFIAAAKVVEKLVKNVTNQTH